MMYGWTVPRLSWRNVVPLCFMLCLSCSGGKGSPDLDGEEDPGPEADGEDALDPPTEEPVDLPVDETSDATDGDPADLPEDEPVDDEDMDAVDAPEDGAADTPEEDAGDVWDDEALDSSETEADDPIEDEAAGDMDATEADAAEDVVDDWVMPECMRSLDCSDGNPCNGLEICDPAARVCTAGSMPPADTVVCRPALDRCDAAERCDGTSVVCPADLRLGEGDTCDDGNPLTTDDRCDAAGLCAGTEICRLTGLTDVTSGRLHACALTASGGARCWGANGGGQLGNGTTTDSPVPVDVTGLSGAVDIEAGGYTCALLGTGGVTCWGGGSTTPVDVTGLPSAAVDLAVGGGHMCVLLDTGGVLCWGDNLYGQLGDGTNTDRSVPTAVVGLSSGVAALAAGNNHTCALLDTGGLMCWGYNSYGQLGDGTRTHKNTPSEVFGLFSGVAAVGGGTYHTCAVLDTGGLMCWGMNNYGQLGMPSPSDPTVPNDVPALAAGVSAVTGGEYHTCALMAAGGVKCWGFNARRQLGNGAFYDSTSNPSDVALLPSAAAAVSAGQWHNCALLDTGNAVCWGYNNLGQLGNGLLTVNESWSPVDLEGLPGAARTLTAGLGFACALLHDGSASCWGRNQYGELGLGTENWAEAPVTVAGLTPGPAAVSAGGYHGCALLDSGGLRCWGYNLYGQVGNGTTVTPAAVGDVTGLTSGVSVVDGGGVHTCALLDTGGLMCWGRNLSGQLGTGNNTNRSLPANVSGLASGGADVSAGGGHTCASMEAGGVKCWGRNLDGQLGDGTVTYSNVPVDVLGLVHPVADVETGSGHSCAIVDTGGLKCWGNNSDGQLGDGTTADRTAPVDVTGLSSGVEQVALGSNHTCAALDSGAAKCWGNNYDGQLGDGTRTDRHVPTDVPGLGSGVLAVAAGEDFSCALLDAGDVKCWGSNVFGQVSGVTLAYPHYVVCE